ncbi:heavy-metal-associated domain-containing protein [Caldithrix abyssi]|nr:heavy-metal-associated domain-containing protein [Caldithrix abyssi]
MKRASLLGLVVALVALWGFSSSSLSAQWWKKGEKTKSEVATVVQPTSEVRTLSFSCTGGGCGGGSAFCCPNDIKTAQKALEKVDGVTKVVMDASTQQVHIDYEPGNLNLGELVQAAKKAGHELTVH